jgi:galactokinase
MNGKEWLAALDGAKGGGLFESLYGREEVEVQTRRYAKLIEDILDPRVFPPDKFPEAAGNLRLFTAAGRTELGGNHTDHNCGKVLAASIQLDAVAVAAPRSDKRVFFRSEGFPDVQLDISDTGVQSGETGTTEALIRGVAAGFVERGIPVQGWTANAASTVLPGSGLSSSAALETLTAKIFDSLYGGGCLPSIELAKISQRAENLFYGKPSGLMDQAASASGGAVAIDFAGPAVELRRMAFNPESAGYTLCVVNTRGNHAGLTPDYAAIPVEMRLVADFFGKQNLREAGFEALQTALADAKQAASLREKCGDRAILRALHFFDENVRVDAMRKTLESLSAIPPDRQDTIAARFGEFLDLVNESGASSWEYLQNIYSPRRPDEQGISLGLALTRNFAAHAGGKKIACRVHGGGFAGTIQVYLPGELIDQYRTAMEAVFGSGALTVLRIRNIGADEIRLP